MASTLNVFSFGFIHWYHQGPPFNGGTTTFYSLPFVHAEGSNYKQHWNYCLKFYSSKRSTLHLCTASRKDKRQCSWKQSSSKDSLRAVDGASSAFSWDNSDVSCTVSQSSSVDTHGLPNIPFTDFFPFPPPFFTPLLMFPGFTAQQMTPILLLGGSNKTLSKHHAVHTQFRT